MILNGYGWVERSAGTGMVRKYFETKRLERNIDRSILELEYGKTRKTWCGYGTDTDIGKPQSYGTMSKLFDDRM